MSALTPCAWTFLAGQLVPAERAFISADNHAFNFGTGAFESFRVYATPRGPAILGLRRHLDRLRGSLHYFAVSDVDSAQVTNALWSTIDQNGIENGYLRLLVFPAGSCAQFDPSNYRWETLIVGFHTASAGPGEPLRLGVAQVRRPPVGSTLPRAKMAGFYAADVASHAAVRREGFDDALVLHHDGTVCEVTGANVFLVKDGELLTPVLPGTIAGVTRRLIIDLAASLDILVREAPLPLADFAMADEVFITGTFHELRSIIAIGDGTIGSGVPGIVTRRLQERFIEVTRGVVGSLSTEWLTHRPVSA